MSTHPGGSAARVAVGMAALLVAGLVATALAACGGAPQELAGQAPPSAPMQASVTPYADGQQPSSPQPSALPPTASRDDAIAEFNRAELELNAALGGGGHFAKPPAQAPSPSGTTSPEPSTPGEARGGETPSTDPCAAACRALASMRRAADHLCGLTGDMDPRCGDARARVKNATDRVRPQCPACSSQVP